jgi:hypothetical protein
MAIGIGPAKCVFFQQLTGVTPPKEQKRHLKPPAVIWTPLSFP